MSTEGCSPETMPIVAMDKSRRGTDISAVTFLRRMASRMAAAAPLNDVLMEVVEFASSMVECNSCFLYVLDGEDLVLRASKNSHPEAINRLKLKLGQGITGWVAEHQEPVVLARNAAADPRFKLFNELPEDSFEAFLSVPLVSRGRLVGVLNLQNQTPHNYSEREIGLISTLGFLVGAEVEMARLENENSQLMRRLETRKLLERAKGILQVELKISEEAAYSMMQRQSQERRRPMKEIAEAIILSHQIRTGGTFSQT